MGKSWKADQHWSLAAASLREACGNEDLAEVWKESFLQLCSQQKIRKQLESSTAQDVARILLHSLGRGHALIKQAIDWENPRIGTPESKSRLGATRGIMWRYAIAYCGWDRSTNSLGITQSTQEDLLAKVKNQLESPRLTDSQKKQILAWIPEEAAIAEKNDECSIDGGWIRDFLGIKGYYHDFPNWLLGEKPMKQAALLAILRNVVCHGSLLPTKATSWGLEPIYRDSIEIISSGFEILLIRLDPQGQAR